MMKKFKSVAVQLIMLLVVGLTFYSISVFAFTGNQLKNGLIKNYEEELNSEEETVRLEIENVRTNLYETVKWLSTSYSSFYTGISSRDAEGIEKDCKAAVDYFHLTKIAFFDTNGNQISPMEYGTISRREFVTGALAGKEEKGITLIEKDIYAYHSLPVRHNGRLIGAIVGEIKVTSDEWVQHIGDFTELAFTVFVGTTRQYTTLDGLKGSVINNAQLVKDAADGKKVTEVTKVNGVDYIVDYFALKDDKGSTVTVLFLGKPLVQIENLANYIFAPLIVFAIILTVIIIGVFVGFTFFKIVKKLNSIGKAVEGLSSGDADLTYRIDAKGEDEFAEISGNVNKFIEMLQEIIKKLNVAYQSLAEIGESLGSNSMESASATNEIMANIESVRKQSQNQSVAVTNTSAVIGQSGVGVDELNNLINDQTAGIVESSAAIEEMLGNITSVTNAVNKMAESFKVLDDNVNESNHQISNVTEKVNQMAEESKNLLQANNMIASVAEQTNLLAMNAAIEAAHAGEAGKGFSVVADEIRKLAETSSAQSKNINVELQTISNTIQEVVSLSNASQSAFGGIMTQLQNTDQLMNQIDAAMNEQETASHQILEALTDMRSKSGEVNDKSSELRRGVENVTEDMSSVSQISDVILGSMDEMAAGSQQISAAAENVSELAQKTKENIGLMHDILNQFKV